jgi:hypothetical protein
MILRFFINFDTSIKIEENKETKELFLFKD